MTRDPLTRRVVRLTALAAIGAGLVLGAAPAWSQLGADAGLQEKRAPSDTAAASSDDGEAAARTDDPNGGQPGASADGPTTGPGAAESGFSRNPDDEDIEPNLVKRQRDRYQSLRASLRERVLPAAINESLGEFSFRDSGVSALALEARNVDFYLADGIGYHIRNLRALLEPKNPGEPVNFDDPEQFTIHIVSGEVLLRPADLDALFNRFVLDYQPRSLSSVSNRTSDDTLAVDVGVRLFEFLPPAGGIPTTLSGPVTVNEDNQLVYSPERVEQFGLSVKPLLSAVGLELADVTPFDREGVTLTGNQLIMNPETMFPPPRIEIDRLSSATLSDEGLTLKFSSDLDDSGFIDPPVERDSYIWMQAGDARFFSVLLVNARLQLVSEDEAPLQFNLYHYRAQSAEGRIRALEDGSLVVTVPGTFENDDYDVHQHTGLSGR